VCVCVCVVHMQPLRNLPSLSAVLIATVGSSLTGCYIDPAHRDAANSLQASAASSQQGELRYFYRPQP